MNGLLAFCVRAIYPHDMALKFHLLYFEILKHKGKTSDCFVCFELGFLQFVGEFFLFVCFIFICVHSFDSVGCKSCNM
jgi:hypothetical protein